MTNYPIHPACALWPRPSDEEVLAIADDIKAKGQLNPIWLFEGAILDGKTRYEACGIAGVEPRFEIYAGDDPVGFTIAQNKLRRHQEPGVLALTVAKLCKLPRGGNRGNQYGKPLAKGLPDRTVAELAQEAGISESTLSAAKTVLANGESNIIEMVRSGSVGVQNAAAFVKVTPREQQRSAVSSDVKGLRHRSNYTPSRTFKAPPVTRRNKEGVPVFGRYNRPVIIPSKKTIEERKRPQPMLTIPLRDVKERLEPIIKSLKQQSRCSMATVSFATLGALTGALEHLVEDWLGGGTEPKRTPNPADSPALKERKAL